MPRQAGEGVRLFGSYPRRGRPILPRGGLRFQRHHLGRIVTAEGGAVPLPPHHLEDRRWRESRSRYSAPLAHLPRPSHRSHVQDLKQPSDRTPVAVDPRLYGVGVLARQHPNGPGADTAPIPLPRHDQPHTASGVLEYPRSPEVALRHLFVCLVLMLAEIPPIRRWPGRRYKLLYRGCRADTWSNLPYQRVLHLGRFRVAERFVDVVQAEHCKDRVSEPAPRSEGAVSTKRISCRRFGRRRYTSVTLNDQLQDNAEEVLAVADANGWESGVE